MLNPVTESSQASPDQGDGPVRRVLLDPVAIPRYLNRPQIVTLKDDTEYHADEFNLWLEPLGDTLTRVLAENLTHLLEPDRIEVFHSSRTTDCHASLAVQILKLDGRRGGDVFLVARWSLFDKASNTPRLTRRTELQEPVNGDSYQSYVDAQNRLVESLGREIAGAMGGQVK